MAKLSIPINEMNQFDLPPVCVITGETAQVGFKPMKFQWYPRWVSLFAVCALLPAAILALILTRRVKGELPFSEQGWAAYRKGKVSFGVSIFGAFATLFVGNAVLMLLLGPGHSDATFFLSLVVAIALPVVTWVAFVSGKTVKVVEISKTHITLDIPSNEAVQRITQHLLGGEKRPAVPQPASRIAG